VLAYVPGVVGIAGGLGFGRDRKLLGRLTGLFDRVV
jgi:hypothetical protein